MKSIRIISFTFISLVTILFVACGGTQSSTHTPVNQSNVRPTNPPIVYTELGCRYEEIPTRKTGSVSGPYEVTIRCDAKVAMEEGGYTWIETGVPEYLEGNPVPKCQEGVREKIYLFQYPDQKDVTLAEVMADMTNKGYRPVNWVELLALGADYPKLQVPEQGREAKNDAFTNWYGPLIVALGSMSRKSEDVESPPPYAIFLGYQYERMINYFNACQWSGGTRFAAIRIHK